MKDLKSIPEFNGTAIFDEPMANHTSFKIGGPADVYAVPVDVSALCTLVRWARSNSLPVFVLGMGTNLLVSDQGIRGVVVRLGKHFRHLRISGNIVTAGAGVTLARMMRESIGRGLAGLEGLAGIPGSVGGAVCMNAGTPDGCVKDSLRSVSAVTPEGEDVVIPADDLGLEYRCSKVPGSGLIITSAVFELRAEDIDTINEVVTALNFRRKKSQPWGVGTAGSVFKNPPGKFAGEILDSAGAKGMQIGGARVSTKHANFIENTGIASANDVRELMLALQNLAAEKFGVVLEPEIQIVGEWE